MMDDSNVACYLDKNMVYFKTVIWFNMKTQLFFITNMIISLIWYMREMELRLHIGMTIMHIKI